MMKTYTITLPDDFAAFVDKAVADGIFDSVDHLVLYGVVHVEDELANEPAIDQDWLKKEIQIGIDELDRGEGIDGPSFMARLRAKVQEKSRTAKPAS